MQKKMIALAVAGLVSGAAFAQTNVTIFGIMDAGYQYSWDSQVSGTKAQSAIKAGGLDGARVGFRGTEDLGNGLKANFEMVAAFDGDTGVAGKTLFNEGSWVGLSNEKWGQIKLGYFGTFLDDNTGIDVSGRHGIASTGAVNQYAGKYVNFAAWYSPVWSGFQVKAGFSSNDKGQDTEATTANYDNQLGNNRIYTGSATYANGGLKLGAVYEYNKFQKVDNAKIDAGNIWQLGAAYDFKVVAVSLLGGKVSYAQNGDEFRDTRKQWAVGLAIPLGAKDVVKLGYGEAKISYNVDGASDDKQKGFGVAYIHSMSKRTDLYALYGNYDGTDKNDVAGSEFATIFNPKAVGANGSYQQAFGVGIRHLF